MLAINKKSWDILKKIISPIEINIRHEGIQVIDLLSGSKENSKIGVKVAEASMGGLGKVKIKNSRIYVDCPKNPTISTLGCQMAGWSIEINDKIALGSGPARILAKKPRDVIDFIGYEEKSDRSVLLLESDILPDPDLCKELQKKIGSEKLLIAVFKGSSEIGVINTVAKIVETAIFRLYHLGYDVRKIVSAKGSAPIPKHGKDAMFISNDAIIYNGSVELKLYDWNQSLTEKSVSKSSRVYGKKFKDIYNDSNGNFYNIDPYIFAPAEIKIMDLNTNVEYHAGSVKDKYDEVQVKNQ